MMALEWKKGGKLIQIQFENRTGKSSLGPKINHLYSIEKKLILLKQ